MHVWRKTKAKGRISRKLQHTKQCIEAVESVSIETLPPIALRWRLLTWSRRVGCLVGANGALEKSNTGPG